MECKSLLQHSLLSPPQTLTPSSLPRTSLSLPSSLTPTFHFSHKKTSPSSRSISSHTLRAAVSENPLHFSLPSPPSSFPPLASPLAVSASAAQQQRGGEADVMGMLLRQRIVFLGNEMNDFVADAIVSQLLLLDFQDPQADIRLFINCPGGSISSAMAIYDAMQLCRADISTVGFGIAASTAALVLAGGSKGKRFAMPNTRIMIHQPLGGSSGQAIDVEIQAKEIMFHKSNITRIMSEITSRPLAEVEKDLDRDRYMSPVEAMEYGILDGVIDQDSIIPLLPTPERVSPKEIVDSEEKLTEIIMPNIPDSEIF